jgi:hypothetical protein
MRSYCDIILSEATYGGLPVSYWTLEEVNGTAATDVMTLARGTGYTGTYTGGYTIAASGPVNREPSRSVLMNGTTGYVSCTNNAALSPAAITVETWVRLSTLPAVDYSMAYSRFGSGVYTQFAVRTSGKLAVFMNTSGGSIFRDSTGANTLAAGQWYHLAMTYSSSAGLAVYVDGGIDFTAAANGTNAAGNTGVSTFGGDLESAGNRFLPASFAHAAIYDYVVPVDRMKAHHLAGVNGVPRSQLLRCA